jgi:tetratricopeptide (TPR) repeat protein
MSGAKGRTITQATDQGFKATARTPDGATPATLYELGLRHMQAGRALDAQLCCEQALASDPHHVGSLHLMGLLALQAKQYDHAIEWIARADRQDPKSQNPKSQHLVSLGIALVQQGMHDVAFRAFDAAVRITPDDAETWLHHGDTLATLQRPVEAVASYQQVLKLNPREANAAYRGGVLLHRLSRDEEALSWLDLCDQLVPNNPTVLVERGLVLHDLNRLDEALAVNLRAQAQNPASPEICNNIGAAYLKLSRYEEALPWLDKALALLPDSLPVLISKAAALSKMLRLDEAFAVYTRAQAIAPGNADIAYLISELQLLTGNFEEGWAGREARWKIRISKGYPDISQPIWLGDGSIAGKTILVYADEGLGDTIQFARYIPMLAARGAKVILWVDDPLSSLLSQLAGVSRLIGKSDPLPSFDLHCPICSLPLAFQTRLETIPSGTSYLPRPGDAQVQAWENRLQSSLGPRRKPRVGLTWSGNPNHWNDRNRSLPLQTLSRLFESDAAFVSLQKEPRPDDRPLLERAGIVDPTAHLTDLVETAALVSCLDLVISVDTAIAHLAGALGRPTWILLPCTPDWRWQLGRNDSPWYPTARLFRQDQRRDYAPVIERMSGALQSWLMARS